MREIFALYLEFGSLIPVVEELDRRGWRMKAWTTREGRQAGGKPIAKNSLYNLLTNMIYTGQSRIRRPGLRGRTRAHRRRRDLEPGPDDPQPQWPARRPQHRQQARRAAQRPRAMRHLRRRHDPHLRQQEDRAVPLLRVREGAPARMGAVSRRDRVSAPALENAVLEQLRGIGRNPTVLREVLRADRRSPAAGRVGGSTREKTDVEGGTEENRAGDEWCSIGGRHNASSRPDRLADLQDRVTHLNSRLTELRQQLAAHRGRGRRSQGCRDGAP